MKQSTHLKKRVSKKKQKNKLAMVENSIFEKNLKEIKVLGKN